MRRRDLRSGRLATESSLVVAGAFAANNLQLPLRRLYVKSNCVKLPSLVLSVGLTFRCSPLHQVCQCVSSRSSPTATRGEGLQEGGKSLLDSRRKVGAAFGGSKQHMHATEQRDVHRHTQVDASNE